MALIGHRSRLKREDNNSSGATRQEVVHPLLSRPFSTIQAIRQFSVSVRASRCRMDNRSLSHGHRKAREKWDDDGVALHTSIVVPTKIPALHSIVDPTYAVWHDCTMTTRSSSEIGR